MTQARFIPEKWEYDILTCQIDRFAGLTAGLHKLRDLNAARAMCRVLEAAARRIIFVLAMMAPALAPRPGRAIARDAIARLASAGSRPCTHRVRLRLVEPMVMMQALQRSCAPPDKGPRVTQLPLAELGLAQHVDRSAPPPARPASNLPESVRNWRRVSDRIAALTDVAMRPQYHANRLRRWMAGQAGRRLQGRFSRPSPLLPGRPKSLQRGTFLHPTRRPNDPAQTVLWEVWQIALRAEAALFPT